MNEIKSTGIDAGWRSKIWRIPYSVSFCRENEVPCRFMDDMLCSFDCQNDDCLGCSKKQCEKRCMCTGFNKKTGAIMSREEIYQNYGMTPEPFKISQEDSTNV